MRFRNWNIRQENFESPDSFVGLDLKNTKTRYFVSEEIAQTGCSLRPGFIRA